MVVRTKLEPKCKICMSPHRGEVEQLLVQQSKQERDSEGLKVTYNYIIEYADKQWGWYLTKDNIIAHLESHFRLKEAQREVAKTLAKQSDRLLQSTVLSEILDKLDATEVRREIIARGLQKIREIDGESITPDHVLKALDQEAKEKVLNPLEALMDAAANAVNFTVDAAKAARKPVETEVTIVIEDTEVEECE